MIRLLRRSNNSAIPSPPNPIVSIKYIQSTGSQYINTGVVPASDVDVEISISDLGYNSSRWGRIVGQFGTSSTADNYDITATGTKDQVAITINNYNNRKFVNIAETGFTTIKVCGSGEVYLNGELIHSMEAYAKSTTYPITLCNGYDTASSVKLAYCKIWKAGILIRDLIPVKINNLIIMQDKVSNNFFINNGGNFIAGEAI